MNKEVQEKHIMEALTDIRGQLKEIREIMHSPVSVSEISADEEDNIADEMYRSELTSEEIKALLENPLQQENTQKREIYTEHNQIIMLWEELARLRDYIEKDTEKSSPHEIYEDDKFVEYK